MWGLVETLNSMFSYQLWDIVIKLLAAFGTIGVGVAAYRKYSYEKNRQIYERRLNEVYAPLYRIIAMQEKYRKLFTHTSVEEKPILYTKMINKELHKISNGNVIDIYEEIYEVDGILTKKNLLKCLNETNFGLARPELLTIISEYELLIHIQEDWEKRNINDIEEFSEKQLQEIYNDPEIKKIINEEVKVERLLVKEIIDGYRETVKRLGISNEYKSIDSFNV